MMLDGRGLEGDELVMHIAAKNHPDAGTRSVLVLMANFISRNSIPLVLQPQMRVEAERVEAEAKRKKAEAELQAAEAQVAELAPATPARKAS
jgi:hypothetical protein